MSQQPTTPLLVGIPTHDGRAMINSCMELVLLGNVMQSVMKLMVGEAGNIPRARNIVMDEVRKELNRGTGLAWVLWLDSDIVLTPGSHQSIAHAMRWSHQTGNAWVANYRMGNHQNVLLKQRDLYLSEHYTDEELTNLPPFAEVAMSGFGLVYLPMDLTYLFHADRWGEDVYFFMDHPNLKIYYANEIVIQHKKTVLL